MDQEIAILYFVAGLFSFLLSVSEALGWSSYRANSISEVVLSMVKARIHMDEQALLNSQQPVPPQPTITKSVETQTVSNDVAIKALILPPKLDKSSNSSWST